MQLQSKFEEQEQRLIELEKKNEEYVQRNNALWNELYKSKYPCLSLIS